MKVAAKGGQGSFAPGGTSFWGGDISDSAFWNLP